MQKELRAIRTYLKYGGPPPSATMLDENDVFWGKVESLCHELGIKWFCSCLQTGSLVELVQETNSINAELGILTELDMYKSIGKRIEDSPSIVEQLYKEVFPV